MLAAGWCRWRSAGWWTIGGAMRRERIGKRRWRTRLRLSSPPDVGDDSALDPPRHAGAPLHVLPIRRSRPTSAIALTLRAGGWPHHHRNRQGIHGTRSHDRAAGEPGEAGGSRTREFPSPCRTQPNAQNDSARCCHVLYLVFNEGYTTSGGAELQRTDLSNEAIRLMRQVHQLLPENGEATGLLAFDAADRRPARGAHWAGRRIDSAR